MPGIADFLRNASDAGQAAVDVVQSIAEHEARETPDRITISAGIDIIEQPNFLRFISLQERTGNGAPPFSIVFDSFLVQRVTRQRTATFDIRYTIGSPVVDVFKDGVEMLSVNATIPDTAPFYTIGGKIDPTAVARAQQDLNLAQGIGDAAAQASAARALSGALTPGIVTGYVGESLEALRSVYNRYFRASAAAGSDQNIIGIVEFWSKGRVDRGYMVKLAFERTSEQLDHAEIAFDFFVARSAFKNIRKPEEIR